MGGEHTGTQPRCRIDQRVPKYEMHTIQQVYPALGYHSTFLKVFGEVGSRGFIVFSAVPRVGVSVEEKGIDDERGGQNWRRCGGGGVSKWMVVTHANQVRSI